MKTLFEQLKPEHLVELLNQESLYPTSISKLLERLKENKFWSELPYSDIITLSIHLKLKDCEPFTISKLFQE